MLNVHDLERRWLRYKIKSYVPHFLSIVLLISGIFLLFLYLPYFKSTTEIKTIVQKEKNETSIKKTILKKEVTPLKVKHEVQNKPTKMEHSSLEVPQNTLDHVTQDKKSLVLTPSLHFMDNIEDNLNPYVDIEEEPIVIESNLQETQSSTPSQVSEAPVKSEVNVPVQQKTKGLSITKKQEESDLKDVIRRFKKNKNPALSLFVAKRYYALEQYQKSYNYALMTNELDKNIDESWIIFSKSLVKLGQHELATLTLKTYLKNSKSTQAEILLRKIESGGFR